MCSHQHSQSHDRLARSSRMPSECQHALCRAHAPRALAASAPFALERPPCQAACGGPLPASRMRKQVELLARSRIVERRARAAAAADVEPQPSSAHRRAAMGGALPSAWPARAQRALLPLRWLPRRMSSVVASCGCWCSQHATWDERERSLRPSRRWHGLPSCAPAVRERKPQAASRSKERSDPTFLKKRLAACGLRSDWSGLP